MDFKEEEINRLKTLFAIHDKNNNGCIHKEDLKDLVQSLGATYEEIKCISNLEQNYFDFPQFLDITSLIIKNYKENDLLSCFQVFDHEKSGLITRKQIQNILEVNSSLDSKEILDIMKHLPPTDSFDYHEFIKNSLNL